MMKYGYRTILGGLVFVLLLTASSAQAVPDEKVLRVLDREFAATARHGETQIEVQGTLGNLMSWEAHPMDRTLFEMAESSFWMPDAQRARGLSELSPGTRSESGAAIEQKLILRGDKVEVRKIQRQRLQGRHTAVVANQKVGGLVSIAGHGTLRVNKRRTSLAPGVVQLVDTKWQLKKNDNGVLRQVETRKATFDPATYRPTQPRAARPRGISARLNHARTKLTTRLRALVRK
jgi:hypothetical protein